jgi:phage host-nuclease inhibitor protein Gam
MKTAKSKRIKLPAAPVPALITRPAAEAAMNDLATYVNTQRQINSDRDAEILAVNTKYEESLAHCSQVIKDLTEVLHEWAKANPDQFPKDRKSIQFASGVLGFRTGTPKLILLNRRWTWKTALRAVQAFLPAFIRDEPSIDAEAIIAQRDELAEHLPNCGLQVTQGESFFVEIGGSMRVTTGEIISAGTGLLCCDLGRLYEVMNFLTGDNLFTHQLTRAFHVCEPWVKQQHPWLLELNTEDCTRENWQTWLAAAEDKFGRHHELFPLPGGAWEHCHPLDEPILKNKSVILIKPEAA